eukprot:3784962-Rhodomonas_salina.1
MSLLPVCRINLKDLRATVAFPFSAAFSNCFRLWFSGDPRLDRLRVCDPGGALANGLLSALCSSRRGGSDRFSFTPPSSNSDIRSVAWRRAAGSKDSRVDIPASTTGTCPQKQEQAKSVGTRSSTGMTSATARNRIPEDQSRCRGSQPVPAEEKYATVQLRCVHVMFRDAALGKNP